MTPRERLARAKWAGVLVARPNHRVRRAWARHCDRAGIADIQVLSTPSARTVLVECDTLPAQSDITEEWQALIRKVLSKYRTRTLYVTHSYVAVRVPRADVIDVVRLFRLVADEAVPWEISRARDAA